MRRPEQLEFFSLGGVLAVFWNAHVHVLPYLIAASILAALSCWDLMLGAGRADFILLGLAAYELVLGLTD